MSNDHIFAAQMWSWADPMIKRDSHGRILVVNAAFLQLYGGTIESWTGNPIDGWPAPKSPGQMSRFESRIPIPTGGETVYDWMECTHQDGTAVALARDVSVYAAKPQVMPAPVAAEPAPAPAPEPSQAQMQSSIAALSPLALTNAAPKPELPVASVQPQPSAQPEPQETVVQPEAVSEIVQPPQAEPAAAPAAAPAPETTPAPQAETAPEEERDFQKRALPIEDGDAILGNNWRDAVIAKAVGVGVDESSEDAAEDTGNSENTAPKPSGKQVKVLLAEDNAINALLTRTLLEAEGCLCDVVEDGALAVEAVKNNEYDLIFMDMRMPNMDGLEATRKIRSMGYGAKVLPIVALTANAFDDDRNACFDSGMNDFMTKPVSAEELSAMVQTHTALEIEKIAS